MPSKYLPSLKQESGVQTQRRAFTIFTHMHISLAITVFRVQTVTNPWSDTLHIACGDFLPGKFNGRTVSFVVVEILTLSTLIVCVKFL